MHKVRYLMSGIAVSIITTLLCVLVTEKAVEYFLPNPYQWDKRLMFFSPPGGVFQNTNWGGHVWQPNKRIRDRTLYITGSRGPTVFDEYQSTIRTNSSGLVQLSDIIPSKPAIIFLGDSFTEGQGASPWFYDLEQRWPCTVPYQIINGGIRGTGIEAWQRLFMNLPLTTEDKKIVVIFISDDWIRPVSPISQRDLKCLSLPNTCDGTNNVVGLPENPAEADIQIHRIAAERISYLSKVNFFKASAINQRLLNPIYLWWHPDAKQQAQFEKSKTAIQNLVSSVGRKNILFIHLPEKHELSVGPDTLGKRGEEFIRQNKYQFVDGFKKCHLTTADFHPHDGHPNAAGYQKILNCVERSVRDSFDLF